MTTDQALEEAQDRVDSFKAFAFALGYPFDHEKIVTTRLSNSQACTMVAIETEIEGYKELEKEAMLSDDIPWLILQKLFDLQLIKEQIQNTL